jgi:protein-S-isoprenylcysteine O-methyltransferase Ste14
MFVGGVIVSGQLLALIGLTIAAFAYWRKILLEEASLRRAFGLAYAVYQRQTGSLIPRHRTREHNPQPKPS